MPIRIITMQDILKQLQVHIPFDQLFQKHLDKVLREQINPEIAFTSTVLDHFTDRDYAAVGNILRKADRFVTFHGPFMDLRPGAIDPKIRRASLERFRRLFEIATAFRPRAIVFHPSYDEKYYVSSGRKWLWNSIDTWANLVPLAEGLDARIALENVY
jgi:sugar phosphate isomerase/epimerase